MSQEAKSTAPASVPGIWPRRILIVALVGGALAFGLLSKPAEMGIFVVACAICLAFENIDKIQSFKGAGFEAEMRKAVQDAYATTEALRALAKPLIRSTVDNLTHGSRWGGISAANRHESLTNLQKLVVSLEIDDPAIGVALEKFRIFTGVDHIAYIDQMMQAEGIKNPEASKAIRDLMKFDVTTLPEVALVEAGLTTLAEEERQRIDPFVKDYGYYREHGKLRRPESMAKD